MKNIIITGGGMQNKGAQSMTFICVSQLQKLYPNDRIILITLANEEPDKYNFDIVKISYPALKCAVKPISRMKMLVNRIKQKDIDQIEAIYKESKMMIDISGYALGSNWADATVDYYLSCIECAKKYNIPVYIMPQSFGPFDYPTDSGMLMRIRETMSYPQIIYAREKEGYQLLKSKFQLNNLASSCDLVLKSKSADIKSVYKNVNKKCMITVLDNAVAVIPNVRTFDHKNKNIVTEYYKIIIDWLLEKKHAVYLINHSAEDKSFCEELKKSYSGESFIFIVNEELDCFDYEEIIKKFDYIIASRYHSIIHALKNSVPCIALGWAIKYKELLSLVGQSDCVLDVRDELTKQDLYEVLSLMENEYVTRSKLIQECIKILQQEDLFSDISEMEKRSDARS